MSELPNTDQQPSIGKMGRISLASINTLAGLSMLSVAKVDGLDIGGKTLTGNFKSTWNTNKAGVTNTNSIQLPLVNSGTYDFTVDWGDGNTDYITSYNQAETLHEYGSTGTYSIAISGTCSGWSFEQQPDTSEEGGTSPSNPLTDRLKISSIEEWGCLRLGTENCNFGDCKNLTLNSVVDVLNLSGTVDLYGLFHGCTSLTTINKLNQWNLSNISKADYMFFGSELFNQNIGDWDVSSVTTMKAMFSTRGKTIMIFNNGSDTSINSWDTSSVTDMSYMFKQSNFNQPIGNWNTSQVTNMRAMFLSNNLFNQPIIRSGTSWNTSDVTDMSAMFYNAYDFNQDISNWITTNVTDMNLMFANAYDFNYPLTSYDDGLLNIWKVSNVTDMTSMFAGTILFNQPLNSWDVKNVQSMSNMFAYSQAFDQPLSNWDVTNVVNMNSMFAGTIFNQDISNWQPYNVYYMSFMFGQSTFNNGGSSLISNWFPVGPPYAPQQWVIQDMSFMFYNCLFNQPIPDWNTSNVTTMEGMFGGSASVFDQDISSWDVGNVTNFSQFMSDGVLGNTRTTPFTHLDAIYGTVSGWASRSMQSVVGKYIDFGGAYYNSTVQAGRDEITGYGWIPRDNLVSVGYSIGGPTGSSVTFASLGVGKFPQGIITDSLDNVYVYNSGGSPNTIIKITPLGATSNFTNITVGSTGRMTIDSSDNIYIPLTNNDTVGKINPAGVLIATYSTGDQPYSCALDSNGNLFVVNSQSNNVTKITPGGTSSVFANVGTSPTDVVIDELNNLYVMNNMSSNISKITPGGTSSIFANVGSGIFSYSIKRDSIGNFYVVDFDNTASVVKKITPGGTVSTFATLGAWCQYIEIDVNDNLFVNARNNNYIYKITPGGTSSVYATTGMGPYAIAIDSLGNKYTANYNDNNVTKIS
jgi:surface protein